ncbi:ribosomal-processing cysteine protease Prp [Miniphocaeibacter massiliensis]|uniref:ribosomal-processing cysteine protease Prp n=1 Tax=Miniphocaeibacter massiliensis TaxID=2041841 RepID=UPI000C1B82B2|nr:ribosomal-processing cysteine protease Prp [Miniphocaeibacter massiliensis]
MIEIVLTLDKDDRIIEIKSKGHAEFDESGKDIVCSAVSVYFINSINTLTEIVKVEKFIDYEIDNNISKLKIRYEGMTSKEVESTSLILNSLKLALNSIKDTYNEYISVEYEEVR